MREFYQQIRLDTGEYRFLVECPGCGKRHYAGKLPLLCRRPEMSELAENGRAGGLRRRLYNKGRVSAVQALMRHYNMCRDCGSWVCNACFLPDIADGICRACHAAHAPSEKDR